MTTRFFPWRSHLSEKQLFECYLAERSVEGVDPRAADHLADCGPCRAQYGELVAAMDESFAVADHETAAVFTPDRLRAQQEQIARRLDLLDHPGRVISFRSTPDLADGTGHARAGAGTMTSRIAAGWIAAAASVGLLVGASGGFLYESHARVSSGGSVASAATATATPTVPAAPVMAAPLEAARVDLLSQAEPEDDSRLMSEVEAAHERPRTQELLAIDTMTPHVREISYRVR